MCMLCRYVLEPSVFDLLDENYRNNIRHNGRSCRLRFALSQSLREHVSVIVCYTYVNPTLCPPMADTTLTFLKPRACLMPDRLAFVHGIGRDVLFQFPADAGKSFAGCSPAHCHHLHRHCIHTKQHTEVSFGHCVHQSFLH